MPFLKDGHLDRRWIFLAMFCAIALPILLQLTFPEKPTPKVMDVYRTIENLPAGSRIVIACDFDPASAGELEPMISAFVRHSAIKQHKLLFMALWLPGAPVIKSNIALLRREFPGYQSGIDYVDLGYLPGNEAVLKGLVSDFKRQCVTDVNGRSTSSIPLTAPITKVQQVELIISVSAGFPGTTEWVQYVGSPYAVDIVAGTTAVQAPALYAYIPRQLIGVLGGIKSAAEYEKAMLDAYPQLAENQNAREGLRRMGPQLLGHVLIILLIVLGNFIYFSQRVKGISQ